MTGERRDESRERIRAGKFRIGPPPYGYAMNGGVLSVVKEKADVVCAIFDMHDNGVSTRAIAKVLAESGVPTPGGARRWGHKMVAIILNRRPFYDGTSSMLYGTMYIPEHVSHEAILGSHKP